MLNNNVAIRRIRTPEPTASKQPPRTEVVASRALPGREILLTRTDGIDQPLHACDQFDAADMYMVDGKTMHFSSHRGAQVVRFDAVLLPGQEN